MQTRRPSVSSLPPPSSPPWIPTASTVTDISPVATGCVSPTQTVWTAASPARTLGHSSPELPPLPTFSLVGENSRTPSTIAKTDKTETSYYTASWGSPYRHPPPSFDPPSTAPADLDSDDLDTDISSLQFGLEHLLPTRLEVEDDTPSIFSLDHLIPRLQRNTSPNFFTLEHLIQSRLTDPESQPSGGPAGDTEPGSKTWVRQCLEERWNREINDWCSEGSVEIAAEDGPFGKPESSLDVSPLRHHKLRRQNKTLNQQDFWRHFSPDQKVALGRMMASKYAVPQNPPNPVTIPDLARPSVPNETPDNIQSDESPLSARSSESTKPRNFPKTNDLTSSAQSPDTKHSAIAQAPKPTDGARLAVPTATSSGPMKRSRKKIMVNGKGCIISIPQDIPRGSPGYPPKPMSAEAVLKKMQHLEDQGFNTKAPIDGDSPPHNRAIWPDEAEIQRERISARDTIRVCVPQKAHWDTYVNSLLEAKLAALGVSQGGEEDIPLPMSRQTSSQQHPGLPFSPPLPTSSAGSHRMNRQGSTVSGSFPLGPSPGHMSRQSIASPAAFAQPRGSIHMHRHSTFASPGAFTHHPISPSGTWSPGNYLGVQDGRGSPALPLNRPDLIDTNSPHSPFGIRPASQLPILQNVKDDFLVQMQLQQQQLQAQLLQQQQQQLLGMRPSSTLAEVPEDDDEEEEEEEEEEEKKKKKKKKTDSLRELDAEPEIIVPTPRGHRHNISESLEREAADAEYHLEKAIDKQFAEGGDFSTDADTSQGLQSSIPGSAKVWEGSRTALHQPQPHNRTHSLANLPLSGSFSLPESTTSRDDVDGPRTGDSDATNPSLEDGELHDTVKRPALHSRIASQASASWKDNKSVSNKPISALHSRHTSKSSISKLNVDAQEFTYNPTPKFNQDSSVSVSGHVTDVPPSAYSITVPITYPKVDESSSLRGSSNLFKPNASVFNPGASAFKPEAPIFNPNGTSFNSALHLGTQPSSFELPGTKTRNWKICAMPSSNFNFSGPSNLQRDAHGFDPSVPSFKSVAPNPAPTNFSSKIFGDINLAAIDMQKPASRSKAIPIMRPDAAQQRLSEKSNQEQEDQEDESGRITQADGREKRARRDRPAGDDVPRFAEQPIVPSQIPWDKSQVKSAQKILHSESNGSSPVFTAGRSEGSPQALHSSDLRIDEANNKPTELTHSVPIDPVVDLVSQTRYMDSSPRSTVEHHMEPSDQKTHKSKLSANARPFEIKSQTGSAEYDFGFHVTKPSRSDEVAARSPTSQTFQQGSKSPTTTFRPSDDGSYKTALESRKYLPYDESESVDLDHLGQSSFNDIDAVMKHMNEEGSDFGIERDSQSWDQSSPRRTPHALIRPDHQLKNGPRSDAPSPSPRRRRSPRDMSTSVLLALDPFADERAAVISDSPVHRLNNADDVPMSDWDEGLLTEGEDKIQMRSRFFDKHVDELMGRLLQNRLDPLEKNLRVIHEVLSTLTQRFRADRRSMSTFDRLDSDADDEDDDIASDMPNRNRSQKTKKFERLRAIFKESFEAHQALLATRAASLPDNITLDQIRRAVTDGWTDRQAESPVEQIRKVIEEVLASNITPLTSQMELIKSQDIRSVVLEALATRDARVQSSSLHRDSMTEFEAKRIFSDALALHHKQTVAPETLKPDSIRAIMAEVLSAHTLSLPATSNEHPQSEMLKSIITEISALQHLNHQELLCHLEKFQITITEIHEAMGSLGASLTMVGQQNVRNEDVQKLLESVLTQQNEFAHQAETRALSERDTEISDLKAKLAETVAHLDAAVGAHADVQGREASNARLLKVTEEELGLLQQVTRDNDSKIRFLTQEAEASRQELDKCKRDRDEAQNKVTIFESAKEDMLLEKIAFETSEKEARQAANNILLEKEAISASREEYRALAEKWQREAREVQAEGESLRMMVEQNRLQTEEATRVRESMRVKFEKLQADMVAATQQIADERATWRKEEEDSLTRYEILSARIEAEGRTRERLERELERLEIQEREGMKLKLHLENTQKNNALLEGKIEELQKESFEHQRNAERYERDMREARDAAHVEIRRIRVLMEADLDAANNQVNIVRHELESEITRVHTELDNVRMSVDTAKQKHEVDLEAAFDAKQQALKEAAEEKKHSLSQQHQAFERQLGCAEQEHARALEFARQDQERIERFHQEKLALADSKLEHLRDKIDLLEEKLIVAKEAASAAVAAVSKSADANPSPGSTYAEKISPQALRESIAVLQEQLQERESRIESLENNLREADSGAPTKLKERETEINWLRELLGVRIDDLNDLVNALAQPSFDRDAVRDAAIRIRTNLQMEQQEKERLITGGQPTFSTLATLSNFASPKAVQIAAAFGNWRKGRGETVSVLSGSADSKSHDQTPSRPGPPTAQSFLSGLMTPPTSNLRRTPGLPSSIGRPSVQHPDPPNARGVKELGFPTLGNQTGTSAPQTPPLMQKASYDRDAEIEPFSENGFYDDESTVDGDMTPLALSFGRELQQQ